MTSTDSAAKREEAIRLSLSAFASSLIGLIPLLGLPWSIQAIGRWLRTPRVAWNPAARYSSTAAFLGVVGLFLSLLTVVVLAIVIAESI